MSEMIAYCGLVCTKCPSFIATQKDDDDARAEASAMLAEKYGFDIKPEDINCDGCLSVGGRHLGYCQTCEIRQCGSEKELENCAHCQEENCEKLAGFHKFSPDAKASFEALKRKL